jgi:transcriptional regulator with XRE-family HTH domain
MVCAPRRSALWRTLSDKGLGVAELAAETGLSLNAIRRIVNGEHEPSIVHALLIAQALEHEVETLFGGRKDVDDTCRAGGAG